ncbi:MAG: hypothetical protein ACM3NS_08915 [Deltaproteobacteria bacterium]
MQRYWVRIAVGALAVFAVGMVSISLGRRVIASVEALAKSDRPIGIPLALLPFRLAGDELGTVRRLELIRSSPQDVSGVRLTVRLQDSTAVRSLRDCAVTLRGPQVFGGREGFVCSSAADSAAEHLEKIGEIVVEPGGLVRALLVPGDHAANWRADLHDTAAARAELEVLKAERLADSTARAVIVSADSARAVIDIRGDSSRSLVRIQADSHGATLHVRNRAGNDIVRLHADSTGASLTVSSDSAPAPGKKR